MKRTCSFLILFAFILNLVIHANIYHNVTYAFSQYPYQMAFHEQNIYSVFDMGTKLALIQMNQDGLISNISLRSKATDTFKNYQEIKDITVMGEKIYFLWNNREAASGKILCQTVEIMEKNSVFSSFVSKKIPLEQKEGIEFSDIFVTKENEIFLSGTSKDKKYAVFFCMDSDTYQLQDKKQYFIESGVYQSFCSKEEKYCLTFDGSLIWIGENGVTPIYRGLTRNINCLENGTLVFQDSNNGAIYQFTNKQLKCITFDFPDAVQYPFQVIDICIDEQGSSFLKIEEKQTEQYHYLTGKAKNLNRISKFALRFPILIKIAFRSCIPSMFVITLFILFFTAIYHWLLHRKRMTVQILFPSMAIFLLFFGIFTLSVFTTIKMRIQKDYSEQAINAARYFEKSFQENLEEIEEGDFFHSILQKRAFCLSHSQTILCQSINQGQFMIDSGKGYFLEQPQKLYSKDMVDFIYQSKQEESGIYNKKPFSDGIFSYHVGENPRFLFFSLYRAEYLQSVYLQEVLKIIIPCFFTFAFLYIMVAIILRTHLKAVSMMKKELENWSKGDYIRLTSGKKNSDLTDIVKILNGSIHDFTARIYQLGRLNDAYYRFVPQNIMKILNRESVVDVEAGDKKVFLAPVAYFLMISSTDTMKTDEQRFERSNQYFSILNSVLMNYQSMFSLINDDLSKITAVFDCQTSDLLSLAKQLLSDIDYFHKKESNARITPLIVIAKPLVTLAMAGDTNRITPMVITAETSTVDIIYNTFESSGCEVILLQSARKDMENLDEMDYRYIGYMEIENEGKMIGMYDYFASCAQKTVLLKRKTLELFNEAMSTFYIGSFEQAKELFSKVLDINGADGIARWYLHRCYEYIDKDDSIDISYALIKKKNFKGF